MFKTFFFKELGAFKRPMVYIFMIIFGFMAGVAVASTSVQIGGAIGNIHKNAPYVIANFVSILSVFGLLMAAAFFNNAALRDFRFGFNEILFSTPLKKSSYFFGRFLGALILACMPLIGVFLGVWISASLAVPLGWLEADELGPFYPNSYLNNLLLFIIPNMLFAGAITYALANRYKSTVISFMGIIVLMMGYIISGTFLSDIENETLGAMLDPFGIRAYSVDTKYFTPAEKNTIGPAFSGLLLQNRLIFIALSFLILLGSYFSFSFSQKQRKGKKKKAEGSGAQLDLPVPTIGQTFAGRAAWLQFKSFFLIDFRSMVKSTTFKILFVCMVLLTISNLSGGFEYFGLQSYPVTYKMVDIIGSNSAIFVIIVLVFFSGELVWRDRESHINEVVDATPHTSLSSLFAKTGALFVVAVSLYFFNMLLGIISQLLNGYTNLELGVYLGTFFYDYLALYLVTCAFLVFIQVLINHKYIGYFVSVLYLIVLDLLWAVFDVNSNMVSVGSTPFMLYSDMNGFGPAATAVTWFNLYWVVFGVLILLLAGIFVKRGLASKGKDRFKVARNNFTRAAAIRLVAVSVIWLGIAGFVYYNVHVLNKTQSSDRREEIAANYEKKFKKYESIAQPKLLAANYNIDIFPEERDVKAVIGAALINQTGVSIDSVHFTINETWEHEISIPGAKQVLNDEETGYQIFELASSMAPGDTLDLEVKAQYITKGFENEVSNTSILRNGTFLNNFSILPSLGYSSNFELGDNDTRKEYDLPEKDRVPKLIADCGPECEINYLSDGKSDWVNVETVISTSSDQIAIAPGSLVEDWQKDGRNYYRYRVDHPSQNFYSFISARFEVARREWNGVDIEVYYDAKHPYNIDKMLDAIEKSLIYYTENFGPYYHKQARIIEFPRYATFAQAFPGTMPYSEGFGFIINLENENDNNVVDAVIAHEMAHQWWAHQEVSASMQGGTMLTESFSEYSALMVMKKETSPLKMKDFLKYDMNRYLSGRSSETEKELPLFKVENQSYIHYGKGSVILYALQDYIGEDKVNNALKNFLDEFKYSTPYPTSLDFLSYLEPEVPDSLQYLLDDWFKEITLYDNRLKEAKVQSLDNGKYRVTLDIESYKLKADTLGNETRVPIGDWIDVGLYADADETELIMEQRVRFDSDAIQLTFEVDKEPVKAAIDPRRILIERIYTDNVKRIEEDD